MVEDEKTGNFKKKWYNDDPFKEEWQFFSALAVPTIEIIKAKDAQIINIEIYTEI